MARRQADRCRTCCHTCCSATLGCRVLLPPKICGAKDAAAVGRAAARAPSPPCQRSRQLLLPWRGRPRPPLLAGKGQQGPGQGARGSRGRGGCCHLRQQLLARRIRLPRWVRGCNRAGRQPARAAHGGVSTVQPPGWRVVQRSRQTRQASRACLALCLALPPQRRHRRCTASCFARWAHPAATLWCLLLTVCLTREADQALLHLALPAAPGLGRLQRGAVPRVAVALRRRGVERETGGGVWKRGVHEPAANQAAAGGCTSTGHRQAGAGASTHASKAEPARQPGARHAPGSRRRPASRRRPRPRCAHCCSQ